MGESWQAGLIFIAVISVIIGIPCIFIAVIGSKMLNKLAYFPSKNPAIQKSVCFWIILVEVAAFTILLMFYHVLADYSVK